MSRGFRAQLVLMALRQYSYGETVTDPRAFIRRVETILPPLDKPPPMFIVSDLGRT